MCSIANIFRRIVGIERVFHNQRRLYFEERNIRVKIIALNGSRVLHNPLQSLSSLHNI